MNVTIDVRGWGGTDPYIKNPNPPVPKPEIFDIEDLDLPEEQNGRS